MKLTDLLKNRDKLRKYDELNEWKEKFGQGAATRVDTEFRGTVTVCRTYYEMPDNIREIIVNAIEAEIKKLDEE